MQYETSAYIIQSLQMILFHVENNNRSKAKQEIQTLAKQVGIMACVTTPDPHPEAPGEKGHPL